MNIPIHHVIVHTPGQVRELIAEAHKIANEAEADGIEYDRAFNKACDLLGQRFTLALPPQQIDAGALQLPRMDIPRGNRH